MFSEKQQWKSLVCYNTPKHLNKSIPTRDILNEFSEIFRAVFSIGHINSKFGMSKKKICLVGKGKDIQRHYLLSSA